MQSGSQILTWFSPYKERVIVKVFCQKIPQEDSHISHIYLEMMRNDQKSPKLIVHNTKVTPLDGQEF